MKLNKEWSAINEKNYQWLYNYVKTKYEDIDEFEFVDKYKRQLMSIIENNKNWSISSKETLLFTVAKYLKLFGSLKYGKMYSDKGFEYLQKRMDKENDNEQDEKEIVNYRPREYFINILNNINFDEIQTLAGHYQYILLSLLVYQPPLRTSVYITTKLITKKDENDHKNNFVWITKRGSLKVYYIVNDDKVSGSKNTL